MNDNLYIVIVDDDPAHIALIKRALKKCNLAKNIISFHSGQQVLDFVYGNGEFNTQARPQQILILLDINMPGLNGIEVLKKLKNELTSQTIPVIMLTTSDDPTEIDTCLQLGCNAYLVKPIEQKSFADTIHRLKPSLTLTQTPHTIP